MVKKVKVKVKVMVVEEKILMDNKVRGVLEDKAMKNNVPLKGKDKAKVRADKVIKTMVVRAQEINSKAKVPTENRIRVNPGVNKVPKDREDRIKIKMVLKMADNLDNVGWVDFILSFDEKLFFAGAAGVLRLI